MRVGCLGACQFPSLQYLLCGPSTFYTTPHQYYNIAEQTLDIPAVARGVEHLKESIIYEIFCWCLKPCFVLKSKLTVAELFTLMEWQIGVL